jgi:hypothetical protein
MASCSACTRKRRYVALLPVAFYVFTYYKGQLRLVSVDFGYVLPFFLHLLEHVPCFLRFNICCGTRLVGHSLIWLIAVLTCLVL